MLGHGPRAGSPSIRDFPSSSPSLAIGAVMSFGTNEEPRNAIKRIHAGKGLEQGHDGRDRPGREDGADQFGLQTFMATGVHRWHASHLPAGHRVPFGGIGGNLSDYLKSSLAAVML